MSVSSINVRVNVKLTGRLLVAILWLFGVLKDSAFN